MSYAIEIHDLTRTFNGFMAVDHLNLKIPEGEIFGFLGPNGAGKTTTVRLLTGLLSPTSGKATIAGFDIKKDAMKIRNRVGVLTEYPCVYERLTLRQNLRYFAEMYDVPKTEIKDRIEEITELLGLGDRLDSPVGTFSKGMKQKSGIARAMIHEPEILFLDEPTAPLDPVSAKNVRDAIAKLAASESRTVFLCTHRLVEAQNLCDHIGIISSGKLVVTGSTETIISDPSGLIQVDFHLVILDDKIIKAVQEVSGVKKVDINREQNVLSIFCENSGNITPNVVEKIVTLSGKILEVKRVQKTLEDVYLEIMKEQS
ncbi:MAG: ABC transporter ATP-binding protein [Promethearchaeota archaeon]